MVIRVVKKRQFRMVISVVKMRQQQQHLRFICMTIKHYSIAKA